MDSGFADFFDIVEQDIQYNILGSHDGIIMLHAVKEEIFRASAHAQKPEGPEDECSDAAFIS